MFKSGKRHRVAVKWIYKYLKGAMGHGIMNTMILQLYDMLIMTMLVIWIIKVSSMICLYFSRRICLQEIISSIHNGHVNIWGKVHVGMWSYQIALWLTILVENWVLSKMQFDCIVIVWVLFFGQTIRCTMSGSCILMWGFTKSKCYLHLEIYYLKIFIL